jgi:hypothetical protein
VVRQAALVSILVLVCGAWACSPSEPEPPPPPTELPEGVEPTFEGGKAAHANGEFHLALLHWVPLAKKGDARAQHNIGQMYMLGEGVGKDPSVAIRLFGNAANSGAALSMFSLGEMHRAGVGTPKDLVQSYSWFTLAMAGGVQAAEAKRTEVAKEMTPEQISTAENLAKTWVPKPATPADPAPDAPSAPAPPAREEANAPGG